MTGVLVDHLQRVRVLGSWLDGVKVAAQGITLLPAVSCQPVDCFAAREVNASELVMPAGAGNGVIPCRVIEAADGQGSKWG